MQSPRRTMQRQAVRDGAVEMGLGVAEMCEKIVCVYSTFFSSPLSSTHYTVHTLTTASVWDGLKGTTLNRFPDMVVLRFDAILSQTALFFLYKNYVHLHHTV